MMFDFIYFKQLLKCFVTYATFYYDEGTEFCLVCLNLGCYVKLMIKKLRDMHLVCYLTDDNAHASETLNNKICREILGLARVLAWTLPFYAIIIVMKFREILRVIRKIAIE